MEKKSFGVLWWEQAKIIRSSYALISFIASVVFFVIILFIPSMNGLKIIPYFVGAISTMFLLYAVVYAIPKGILIFLNKEVDEINERNKLLADVKSDERIKNLLAQYPREKMEEIEKKVNYQLKRLPPPNNQIAWADFWNAPIFPAHIMSQPIGVHPIRNAIGEFLNEMEHMCNLIESDAIDEEATRKIYGKYIIQSFERYNLFFKDMKNSNGELIIKYSTKWHVKELEHK